jgi:ligand-binding sensor domain-containing protein
MAEYGDTLLLSTSGGLVFFDKTSQQVVNVLNTVSNPALPCQGLGSIAVDRSRKWCYVALQEEEGFVRLDVEANTVTHFNKWNLPELPSDAIQAMRVDAQGDLWIGSADQGLWVGVPGLSFSASFTSELPEQAIVDIAFAPDGATWVATKNSTAKIVGGALTEVYLPTDSPLPPAPVPGINAVMADESGLWVGAKNGLHRLQDGEWQTFDADDFGGSSSVVTSIAAGQNGRVFVGLQLNSRMLVYDGEAWDAIDCLGSPYGEVGQIMRLVKDEARLWAGCAYGLYAWDETLGCQSIPTASFPIFRNRIENLLISSNAVYAIYQLKQGSGSPSPNSRWRETPSLTFTKRLAIARPSTKARW